MNESAHKLPRLYVDAPLAAGIDIPLSPDHAHYFKTVLRRQDGDSFRAFNGRDGEWICTLEGLTKKSGMARPVTCLKPQGLDRAAIRLYFAPIKKNRMDWIIEKAVELGATDLHPVITQNTEIRDINAERVRLQMIEAAEQCERLDIPVLHPVQKLHDLSMTQTILICIERHDTKPVTEAIPKNGDIAFMIGPEGGFTATEIEWITKQPSWIPVSLGSQILRAETAACMVLALAVLR